MGFPFTSGRWFPIISVEGCREFVTPSGCPLRQKIRKFVLFYGSKRLGRHFSLEKRLWIVLVNLLGSRLLGFILQRGHFNAKACQRR